MNSDPDLLPHVVAAEWSARRFPVSMKLGSSFMIIGHRAKVSYTLGGLLRATNNLSKGRAGRCNARLYRKDYRYNRYLFSVKCFESYSGGPYIVRIQLLPGEADRISDRQVRVSCSCPAWQFWGPDWNAKTKDYLEGRPRGMATPPRRDPAKKRRFYVCKHVAACVPAFNRLIPLDVEQVL